MLSFLFETALKKYCQSNPLIAEKLTGKSFIVTLLPLKQHWKISFNYGDIVCYSIFSEEVKNQEANLKISATPQALLAMLLRHDRTGLKLEGDMVLAQTLEQCFNDALVKNAVEKLLQEYLGDFSFYPVKTLFKKGREQLKSWQNRSKNTITDYLQEDNECLPIPSEVKTFCNEVDELRLRVDRLDARFHSGNNHEKT